MQKILVEHNSMAARIHRRELVAARVVGLLHEAQAAGRRLQQCHTMQEERIARLLAGADGLRGELGRTRALVADAEHHLDESVEARKRLEVTFLEQLRKKVDNNERLRCLLSEKIAQLNGLTIENGRIHSGLWLYQRATAALAVLLFGTVVTFIFI